MKLLALTAFIKVFAHINLFKKIHIDSSSTELAFLSSVYCVLAQIGFN